MEKQIKEPSWDCVSINAAMEAKGFNDDDRAIINKMQKLGFDDSEIIAVDRAFKMQRLMLMVSELGEACEALRKGKTVKEVVQQLEEANMPPVIPVTELNPNSKVDIEYYGAVYKDTYEDELVDADIRILHNSGLYGVEHEAHKRMKMAYNLNRPYKHGKNC
jgi:hypothetical protein